MLTYYSAAKINLYLRVNEKQKDGYHDLVSVMQSVSLYDRLEFDFSRRDFSLSAGKHDLGDIEKNTVTRAWRLMQKKFALPDGVEVTLSKNIPIAAGLGGGSGNAAATLHAVNSYFELGLSTEELAALGEDLGADVPFCIQGGTALARGKGERLTPLKDLPKCSFLLTNNGAAVSTAEAFAAFDALPQTEAPSEEALLSAIEDGKLTEIGKALYNDLERVTLPQQPAREQVKKDWAAAGLFALMSGSGPSVFGLAPQEEWKTPFVSWEAQKGKLFQVTPVSYGVIKEIEK